MSRFRGAAHARRSHSAPPESAENSHRQIQPRCHSLSSFRRPTAMCSQELPRYLTTLYIAVAFHHSARLRHLARPRIAVVRGSRLGVKLRFPCPQTKWHAPQIAHPRRALCITVAESHHTSHCAEHNDRAPAPRTPRATAVYASPSMRHRLSSPGSQSLAGAQSRAPLRARQVPAALFQTPAPPATQRHHQDQQPGLNGLALYRRSAPPP